MSCTVTFWGVRGSIPTPGRGTAIYGGNTPCIGIRRPGRTLLVLDAGSGLRPLGHELMRAGGVPHVDLLLSHTHWDHIQGLPFFKPLSMARASVTVHGAPQDGVPLEVILDRQMDPMVFPVPLKAFAAAIAVTDVAEGTIEVDGFDVSAFRLRHPGTTLGFRLAPSGGARELAYVTDNELGPGGTYPLGDDWRSRFVAWLAGVDTLVHDAMYTAEMIEARAGWGHSTPAQAIDLAAEAGVRHLVLFHHEPEHDDDAITAHLAAAREYARERAPGLEVSAAYEGMEVEL